MANYFVSSASGAGGAGNGSSWANAYLTIAAALARPTVAGDILFIGDDHTEFTSTTNLSWFMPSTTLAPSYMFVVDHTKASPGPADLKVGTPTGGYASGDGVIAFNLFGHVYGLYVECGVGSASTNIAIQTTSSRTQYYENCTFKSSGTNASARCLNVGSSGYTEFKNCTFITTRATMMHTGGFLGTKFINCTFLFPGGSAVPAFTAGIGTSNPTFEACDFSNYAGTHFLEFTSNGGNFWTFKDCKLSSTMSFSMAGDLRQSAGNIWVINCDSGATNYKFDVYNNGGELHAQTSVVRTGGASQGNAYSWQITTNTNNLWYMPFKLPPLSIWNNTTGAAINVTVEGIADTRDFFQLPKNDEVWFDVEALENASLPQGTYHVGTKTTPLGTNSALTASTAAWDCANTRANSTAYNLGDIIKVASNPGRLFMCTGLTTGITASSEPGGYATAVDGGGGVTDGGCVFKAMWRFKQTITTGTIGMAGLITVYPKVAKASLNGIYIDPMITLS